MRTAVFSIISPNYLHYARVLMDSLAAQHPDWDRFVLFVGEADGATHPAGEPFTAVALDALALPGPRRFCFRYTILELNTAVKPWMFEHLFARGYDRVVFLDPDIRLYSPLTELDDEPQAFLTLTPHLTGVIGGEHHPSERSILQAGSYNLGFLAVTRQASLRAFLRWWQEKLEFECVVDLAHGLFVDQKWIDLAPGLFPGVRILRHDGYNVAYWNLRQRAVQRDGDACTVNGQPLRFVHFSGFDPADPDLASKHQHGLTLRDVGQARALFEGYAAALRARGSDGASRSRYAFGTFRDGTPLPTAARIAYRNSSRLQQAAGDDPFAHPDLFLGLRDQPVRPPLKNRAGLVAYAGLSRLRLLVRLVPKGLRQRLREWLLGRREGPRRGTAAPLATTLQQGLNIVGYLERQTGVAESARLCQLACESVGLPSQCIDIDRGGSAAPAALYRASIYHANADQLPVLHGRLVRVFEGSRFNIGCWHWELPELPDAWIASADPLQEIWASSSFIQRTLAAKLRIPVLHMPHGIDVSALEPCSPQALGVPPGRFTVLCMFDLGSVLQRKNPDGAVDAFRRAFGNDDGVALLVKVSHADRAPDQYAQLRRRLAGMDNVYISDRMLGRPQVNGLLASCDALLSLHRAEGFGLILAEAMALGKPVVATGWSGNMDFMDTHNSAPVDFRLVALEADYGDYRTGQTWAEPDLDHAAALLQRLAGDTPWRAQLGARAKQTIDQQFSPQAAGLRYRKRLQLLGLLD